MLPALHFPFSAQLIPEFNLLNDCSTEFLIYTHCKVYQVCCSSQQSLAAGLTVVAGIAALQKE